VLDRLDKHTSKLKPTKCHLFQRKVSFLGHVVSARGIECDPSKTVAISAWPRPTSVSEVRTFCGLASYYRTFVPHFAHVAKPLHDLTKKNVTFVWTKDCETSFLELQKRLTSLPILAAPRDEDEYVLDTDASDCALGAVLHQKQDEHLRVIGYVSRSLTMPERRYCITRRELLGVVSGLRKFRQHLLGRRVVVHTDHAALTHLMRTPEPIGQQGRWLDFLAEFDLEIVHRAGKNHSNSDALSRRPSERGTTGECPQCVRGTTVSVIPPAGPIDECCHNSSPEPQSSSSSPADSDGIASDDGEPGPPLIGVGPTNQSSFPRAPSTTDLLGPTWITGCKSHLLVIGDCGKSSTLYPCGRIPTYPGCKEHYRLPQELRMPGAVLTPRVPPVAVTSLQSHRLSAATLAHFGVL